MPESAAGSPLVVIVMGSDSDWPVMRGAKDALERLQVPCEARVLSAHRSPRDVIAFAESARARGVRVVIAGAGGAAHLGGVIAAITELPVIGVPVPSGSLQGIDALLSIAQMPKGIPVATVAIGGAWNAGLLAAQILAAGGAQADTRLLDALRAYKDELEREVRAKKLPPEKSS
jgi:5-(carboxyamino)imidazole ribonucleotide mutase